MAISVDTIYQRVLALANKEQRGYITPQEYNLLANHAQMAIFESYFYDKNQRNRIEDARSIEVDETDISELLDRKLAPFQSYEATVDDTGHTFPSEIAVDGVNYDVFQTGVVLLGDEPCQKVSMFEAQRFRKSIRHMAVTDNQAPFYTDNRVSGRDIVVYAGGIDGSDDNEETAGVTVECFRVPKTVAWGYVVVNGKALYNSATSVNFELHRSEEDTLTNKILEFAGIVMNKPGLTQVVTNYSAAETTSQKS